MNINKTLEVATDLTINRNHHRTVLLEGKATHQAKTDCYINEEVREVKRKPEKQERNEEKKKREERQRGAGSNSNLLSGLAEM